MENLIANKMGETMDSLFAPRKIPTSTVTDVFISSIDLEDYPYYSDAYVACAKIEGKEATQDQLDALSRDYQFIYDSIINQIN